MNSNISDQDFDGETFRQRNILTGCTMPTWPLGGITSERASERANINERLTERATVKKQGTDKGKPEAGKIYALTGGKGTPSIAAGNTWAESEVTPVKKKDN